MEGGVQYKHVALALRILGQHVVMVNVIDGGTKSSISAIEKIVMPSSYIGNLLGLHNSVGVIFSLESWVLRNLLCQGAANIKIT